MNPCQKSYVTFQVLLNLMFVLRQQPDIFITIVLTSYLEILNCNINTSTVCVMLQCGVTYCYRKGDKNFRRAQPQRYSASLYYATYEPYLVEMSSFEFVIRLQIYQQKDVSSIVGADIADIQNIMTINRFPNSIIHRSINFSEYCSCSAVKIYELQHDVILDYRVCSHLHDSIHS